MNYILASFRSRNETMAFARLLRNNGVQAGIINTPSQISGQSCSVSVKIQPNALAITQRLLNGCHFQTLNGLFLAFYQNGRLCLEAV